MTFSVKGSYGYGEQTPCTVFVYETNFGKWYVVEGSRNINLTQDEVEDGIDVEDLTDLDVVTAAKGIESTEELRAEVLEYLEYLEEDDPEEDE